jgi:glycerol-3-phosphate acyltransferase PlsY
MALNDILFGLLAMAIGYLVGAFPSAYIITRLFSGKDIRTVGTGNTGVGNAGTRNVYVNVGKLPGIIVAILDVGKGTGAIFFAQWVLNRPGLTSEQQHTAVLFLLGAGLAAIIGHIWPVYIKFRGGGGMATSLGVLAVLMPRELVTGLSVALVAIVITRNLVFSVNIGIASMPAWAWYFFRPWWLAVYPFAILAVMLVHFAPNILAEWKKAGSVEKLLAGLMHRRAPPPRKRK